jgi:putative ABC transport system permease protein
MLIFKMALSNLLGAGLRTWLNVTVLSFSFVVIISLKGMLDGWDRQAKRDMTDWEVGGGQYWQQNYDPDDPFTLTDSHGKIPDGWTGLISEGELGPVLITQGTLYPGGRMKSVLVKGIDPGQTVLKLPTSGLTAEEEGTPAIIGSAMAESTRLGKGDQVTLRWRDKNGAFDAVELTIVGVFETNVPSVDAGQVWIPLSSLREMMLLPDEATIIVRKNDEMKIPEENGWRFQDRAKLLEDIDKVIKAKTMSSGIFWMILLLLALLAIFDTQVLSIFRRQKEIGTYVALGMTKKQVVLLFTTEGAMHAVLAAFLGAIYGIPLLILQAVKGIQLPLKSSDYGLTIADKLYPEYGLGLILSTILIIFITTSIVSYWPSRRISKMKPGDALKGRMQ